MMEKLNEWKKKNTACIRSFFFYYPFILLLHSAINTDILKKQYVYINSTKKIKLRKEAQEFSYLKQ